MNYVYYILFILYYLIYVLYNIIIPNSRTFIVFAQYVTFRILRDMSN